MKIMLLAFEVEGFPLLELAKMLKEEGHDPVMVHCDLYAVTRQRGEQLMARYEREGISYRNLKQPYQQLHNTTDYKVDWNYLRDFEKRECHSKGIEQLRLTHEMFGHNFRYPRYRTASNEQLYFWMELMIRWCEAQWDDIKPDLIFTLERNYFVKNVFHQMSIARKTRMLTLVISRVRSGVYFSEIFGLGSSPAFRQALEKKVPGESAKEFIDHFIHNNSFSTYDGSLTEIMAKAEKYKAGPVLKELRRRWGVIYRNKQIRFNPHGENYMTGIPKLLYRHALRNAVNQIHFGRSRERVFRRGLPDKPFLYFPLHTLPESSALTLSNEYYEDDLIRYISKELPAGTCIVVKENPLMIGDRPSSYYRRLTEIPNVYLIDPLASSKEILAACAGVSGLSGTALLEGTILGKPAHCFGLPEFIDIVPFRGYEQFPDFVRHCFGEDTPLPKALPVEKYIQYMLDESIHVNWREMLYGQGSEQQKSDVRLVGERLLHLMTLGSLDDHP
ncbi:MAG: hypothetical protein KDD36_10360 [Flavobacteriales bacterium]|nr:hypothetical protein [Flavobacteriales bacterium]